MCNSFGVCVLSVDVCAPVPSILPQESSFLLVVGHSLSLRPGAHYMGCAGWPECLGHPRAGMTNLHCHVGSGDGAQGPMVMWQALYRLISLQPLACVFQSDAEQNGEHQHGRQTSTTEPFPSLGMSRTFSQTLWHP